MVEIDLDAFVEGKAGIISIIIVLLQHHHAANRERFNNTPRDRGLARAGASADPDNEWTVPGSLDTHAFRFAFFLESSITACAAARRAIATRKGEALT